MFDIKKIAEKINEFSQKANEKKIEPNQPEKRKFPIFEFVLKPFNLFFDNSKKMLIISLIYGAVLSLVSFAFGYSYVCSFSPNQWGVLYCADTNIIYIIYLFIKMFIVSNLMIVAYGVLQNDENQVFSFTKNMKSFGLVIFFVLMLFFPVISIYILFEREPNPNFVIETIFFAFVSIGFMFPFIAVRFFGIYPCLLFKEKTSMKFVWEATKGKILHILVSLFFIMFVTIVVYRSFYVAISESEKTSDLHIILLSEYIYSIVLSIVFIFITGHIFAQKTMILDEEK